MLSLPETLIIIISFVGIAISSYHIGLYYGEKKCLEKQPMIKKLTPIELPKNYKPIINSWVKGELSAEETAKQLGIGRSTLYKKFGNLKRDNKTQ